jgi:hypothetical protein
LQQQILYEFRGSNGRDFTTSDIVDRAYFWQRWEKKIGTQKWHRANVTRALKKVAIPIGRSPKGRGRPMLWQAIPELIEARSWKGRLERRQQRKAGA